jgi:2-phospho-L-lactate guanylyltransferase
MSLCAIIPVKPLRRGKSRLSGILSSNQREALNEYLLTSILECLKSIDTIDHRIVISYDPTALAVSRKFGANTVLENRNTNINRALRRATMAAIAYGATKLLILPADLPLVSETDLLEFLALESGQTQMIIAPDRKMDGTNALFINPIGAIKYNFGEWSYRKHIEQAERKGIDVSILQNKNLAFDLDVPEDWELLRTLDSEKNNQINQLFQEVTT